MRMGEIDIKIAMDIASLQRDLNRATGAVESSTKKMGDAFSKIGKIVAAAYALDAIADFVRAQGEAAMVLKRTADTMGTTASSVSALTVVFEKLGIEADATVEFLQDTADKIGDAFATGSVVATEAADMLGLSLEKLTKMSADEQIYAIAGGLKNIGDQSQKIFVLESLASNLSKLLPILDQGEEGLRKLTEEAIKSGKAMTDLEAAELAEMNTELTEAVQSMEALGRKVLVFLAPAIAGVAEMVSAILDDIGKIPDRLEDVFMPTPRGWTGADLTVPTIVEERDIAAVQRDIDAAAESLRLVNEQIIKNTGNDAYVKALAISYDQAAASLRRYQEEMVALSAPVKEQVAAGRMLTVVERDLLTALLPQEAAAKKRAQQIELLNRIIAEVPSAADAARRALAALSAGEAKAAVDMAPMLQAVEDYVTAQREAADAVFLTSSGQAVYAAQSHVNQQIIAAEAKGLTAVAQAWRDASGAIVQAALDSDDATRQIAEDAVIEDMTRQLNRMRDTAGMTEREIAQYDAVMEHAANSSDEFKEQVRKLAGEMYDLEHAADAVADAADPFADAWDDALGRVGDAFEQTFHDLIKTGELSFETLGRMAEDLVADLATTFAKNAFTINMAPDGSTWNIGPGSMWNTMATSPQFQKAWYMSAGASSGQAADLVAQNAGLGASATELTAASFSGSSGASALGTVAAGAAAAVVVGLILSEIAEGKPTDAAQWGNLDLASGIASDMAGFAGEKFSQGMSDARDVMIAGVGTMAASLTEATGTAMDGAVRIVAGERIGFQVSFGNEINDMIENVAGQTTQVFATAEEALAAAYRYTIDQWALTAGDAGAELTATMDRLAAAQAETMAPAIEEIEQQINHMSALSEFSEGGGMLGGLTEDLEALQVQAQLSAGDMEGLVALFHDYQLSVGVFSKHIDPGTFDEAADTLAAMTAEGETMAEAYVTLAARSNAASLALGAVGDSSLYTIQAADALGKTLLETAGSMDNLMAQTAIYYERFFSEEEQRIRLITDGTEYYTAVLSQHLDTITAMGMAIPATNEQFRLMVEAIDLSTEAGAELFAAMMSVAGVFADVTDAIAANAESLPEPETYTPPSYTPSADDGPTAEEIEAARQELYSRYYDLIGADTLARDIERTAELNSVLDESHKKYLQAIYDREDELRAMEQRHTIAEAEAGLTEALLELAQITGDATRAAELESRAHNLLIEMRELELETLTETERATQLRVWELEDEIEAIERQIAVAEERADLESQLLSVTGDIADIRAKELEQLDETNRALQEQIWALEDAAEVADERTALEDAWLQAVGAVVAIRAQELVQLDETNRALQERVWRLEDEAELLGIVGAIASGMSGLTLGTTATQMQSVIAGMQDAVTSIGAITARGDGFFSTTDEQIRDAVVANAHSVEMIHMLAQQWGLAASDLDRAMGWAAGEAQRVIDEYGLEPLVSYSDPIQAQIDFAQRYAEEQIKAMIAEQESILAKLQAKEAIDELTESYTEATDAIKEQINAQRELADALTAAIDSLDEKIRSLYGTTEQQSAAARMELAAIAELSRQGQWTTDLDTVSDLISRVSPRDASAYATQEDMLRDQAAIARDFGAIRDQLGGELDTAEATLAALEAQLEQAETAHQESLDALQAIIDAGTTTADQVEVATKAIRDLRYALDVIGSPGYAQTFFAIGRSTGAIVPQDDSATRELIEHQAETNERLAELTGVSRSINNETRNGSAYGARSSNLLDFIGFTRLWSMEKLLDNIRYQATRSADSLRSIAGAMGTAGYADGGVATGPSTGHLELLHGTEAVVPLPDGRSIPVALSGPVGGGDNQADVAAEVRALRAELAGLRRDQAVQHHATYREQRDQTTVIKKWDVIGMPAEATA